MARLSPWVAAGLAGEALMVGIDVASGTSLVVRILYILPPLALALRATSRDVAAVAVVALALAALSGEWNMDSGSSQHVLAIVCVALAGGLTFALVRARERADEARRETAGAQQRLDQILGALPEAVTVTDATGQIVYANQAAADLLGVADANTLVQTKTTEIIARFEVRTEEGGPVDAEDLPGRRIVRGEEAGGLLTRGVDRETGAARWFVTRATPLDDPGGTLAVNVIEDVTEAKENDLRQRFLTEAAAVLASSLDYERTLQQVADLMVPELADWATVELPDERGTMQQVAVAHIDPAKVALARELRERYPPDPDAPQGSAQTMRTGRPMLIPEIPFELLEQAAQDEEHLRIMRELELRSAMGVPMMTGGRAVGVLTLVTTAGGRIYSEDDLRFATAVADRAAVAVENARLYSELSHIAETLQASLLPETLPELQGWEAAAEYRAGERGSEVGGDFYDVVPGDQGHLALLGDVSGKGVAAAALTSLVRHTARTGALYEPRPEAVLALVNRVLRQQPALSPVTMAVVSCTAMGRVEISVGGHPPPFLKHPGGPPERVGEPGLLLGVVDDYPQPAPAVLTLEPGDILLLFTDGVTDTPGEDGRFGEERLRQAVESAPDDPAALLAAITAALDDYQHGTVVDDRAMLALRFTG